MASIIRAAATVPRRSGGVSKREFSALLTPLEEFPGLPSTSPTPASASEASVTTLPSGLTIVSENASSTSTISLTFPKAGSSSESVYETGAALANKCMAFQSGSGLSSAVILRSLENDGATPFATAGRYNASVGYTAAPDKAAELVALLATNCSFEKWDVRDALKTASIVVEEANTSAQTVLSESIFAAAFGAQSPMGKPYYSTGASATTIQSFRENAYVLNGAVLAATGISNHEAFVRTVEESFSEAAVGSAPVATLSEFVGGETRVHAPSTGYAHLALAFPSTVSGPLMSVIKKYLSISAENVSGFAASGIIGVYAGASSAEAGSAADALCATVTSAPSAAVIERAKTLAKADALFALDDGSRSLAESMTASVLESGSYSFSETSAAYDAITAADVSAVITAMAKSTPAFAAVGDITSVPYHGTLVSRFS